jgi:glucose/arabinose dehydrogenase
MPSLPRIAAVTAAVLVSATVSAGSSAAATDPLRPSTAVAAAASDVATGLQVPWAMVPLADGAALVTERNTGRIYRVKPGTPKQLYATVPGVVASGEGGLLGIALSQAFPKDRRYFVYYTTAHDNRVAMMLAGSTAAPRPIVTTIRKAGNHNGGGLLVMGNDLYIGTGDAADKTLPQYSSSLNGKVLRVRYDGTPSAGNRWGKVFTMGHRNVQGLTPAPDGKTVYATELGQNDQDEVNWIRSGGLNYGWPNCEGRCTNPRYTNPIQTWLTSEASPSGISSVGSGSAKTYYVGALRGTRLWKMKIVNNRVVSRTSVLQGTYGRIRAVMGRTDGSLWFTTSNNDGQDRVIRLAPAP